MSTTTSPSSSPAELVRSLPLEAKGEVLFALLRELIAMYGGKGLIPLTTADGESLGYYVPPEAARSRFDALLAAAPAEVRAALVQPLPDGFDEDDCLSDEELAAIRAGQPRSP